MDMIEEEEKAAAPVVTAVPTPVPTTVSEEFNGPVRMESTAEGSADLSAGLKPDTSYSGMGRGYVQTNFDVNLAEPGKNVNNHEILTARGLFDVHVAHEFNG